MSFSVISEPSENSSLNLESFRFGSFSDSQEDNNKLNIKLKGKMKFNVVMAFFSIY